MDICLFAVPDTFFFVSKKAYGGECTPFFKALLKHIVDFAVYVDWSGRHETPAGKAGLWETPQAQSAEEAPRQPAESEVPGAEINRHV
jgi:hypothetical protein